MRICSFIDLVLDPLDTAEVGAVLCKEIRKLIYTTNAVESYHRVVRKFTKSKTIFSTDDSLRKVIYMSVREISKKWTMPVKDWGLAYQQFAIYFEARLAA